MVSRVEIIIDTRGLICPLPLLKAKQALKKLSTAESLRIWVDDKASIEDLRLLVSAATVEAEEVSTTAGTYFLIRKKV